MPWQNVAPLFAQGWKQRTDEQDSLARRLVEQQEADDTHAYRTRALDLQEKEQIAAQKERERLAALDAERYTILRNDYVTEQIQDNELRYNSTVGLKLEDGNWNGDVVRPSPLGGLIGKIQDGLRNKAPKSLADGRAMGITPKLPDFGPDTVPVSTTEWLNAANMRTQMQGSTAWTNAQIEGLRLARTEAERGRKAVAALPFINSRGLFTSGRTVDFSPSLFERVGQVNSRGVTSGNGSLRVKPQYAEYSIIPPERGDTPRSQLYDDAYARATTEHNYGALGTRYDQHVRQLMDGIKLPDGSVVTYEDFLMPGVNPADRQSAFQTFAVPPDQVYNRSLMQMYGRSTDEVLRRLRGAPTGYGYGPGTVGTPGDVTPDTINRLFADQ